MFIPTNQTCSRTHIVLAQVHLCYGLAVLSPNLVLCLACTAGLWRGIVPWKRYIFVLNLSIADGLYGLCVAVMALLIMYDCSDIKFLRLVGVGTCMSVIQTIYGHISISVMQYWAVKQPLFYGMKIRRRCCSVIIALSWVLALAYAGMEWFVLDQYGPLGITQWTVFFLTLVGACILLNLTLNLYVAHTVIQHHNRRRQNTRSIISMAPRLVASASAPSIHFNNTMTINTSLTCLGRCNINSSNSASASGKHRHASAAQSKCNHRYCDDNVCAMDISNNYNNDLSLGNHDCNNNHRLGNHSSGHLLSCHYNRMQSESSPTITTAILQHSPVSDTNFNLIAVSNGGAGNDLYFQHPLHQLLTNNPKVRRPGSDSSMDSLTQMLMNGGGPSVSPKQSSCSTTDAGGGATGGQFTITTDTNSTTSSPGLQKRRGSSRRSKSATISNFLNYYKKSKNSTKPTTITTPRTKVIHRTPGSFTSSHHAAACDRCSMNMESAVDQNRYSGQLALPNPFQPVQHRRKSSIHLDQIARQHRHNMLTVLINIAIYTVSYAPPWLLTLYMLLTAPSDSTRLVLTAVATACFMLRSFTDPIVHLVRESRFHSCRLFHGPKYQPDMKFSNASIENTTSPTSAYQLAHGFV